MCSATTEMPQTSSIRKKEPNTTPVTLAARHLLVCSNDFAAQIQLAKCLLHAAPNDYSEQPALGKTCISLTSTSATIAPELLHAASNAEQVIFLIDATSGLEAQIGRQAQLFSLLGIKHAVAVIDTTAPENFTQASFEQISQHLASQVKSASFTSFNYLPLSSLADDNVRQNSHSIKWYQGPSLLDWLDNSDTKVLPGKRVVFPIEKVKHADNQSLHYSGQLAEGQLELGDNIRITRSGQTAQVKRLITENGDVTKVAAGGSLTLELAPALQACSDDVLSLASLPLETTDQFEATLVWITDETGLTGRSYRIKLANQQTSATLINLKHRINLANGSHEAQTTLKRNDVSTCNLATSLPLVFDTYSHSHTLGSFQLLDPQTETIIAFGMINHSLRRAQNVHTQALSISAVERALLNGHKGKVIWFTGLSGSGKSTIANALEVELHALGYRTYLLDGDNVRQGLNKDLGFTDADRVENIRRIAEVAKLMLDAGLVVMTAFISPFRRERQMARELIGENNFIEVYVSTPLEVCEQRDVKGLYKKARSGQLPNLSGVGSPYEAPTAADIEINAAHGDMKTSITQLLRNIPLHE